MEKRDDNQAPGDFTAGLSAPARRALTEAGYQHLAQVAEVTEKDLLKLHGMGPKAIRLIRGALAAEGLSFKGETEVSA